MFATNALLRTQRRIAWSGTFVLILGLAQAPAVWADRNVSTTLEAAPDVSIEIENIAGSIEVRGWDRNEVQVTGTIGDDVEEFVAKGGKKSILIEVETPDRRGWRHGDIDGHLDIRVPRGARVEIETISASIDVDDLDGRLEAESVSGSIKVSGRLTSADMESISGSVRLNGANTRTVAETVSGSIRLEGVAERVEASSVSGSITVKAGAIERGELESVSGTIRLECDLKPGARLDVSSHSGNLTVTLQSDVSASFEATTFAGSIVNDFGPQATRTSKWVESKSLEFTTGSGDAEVSLETFSGNLRIERR